jgi:acyl-CoA synthetase (AMP-forming)/AMP-acid ligase II
MVPELLEFLAALPRTSSGKVDRRALADMTRHKES